jgi:hypothetical protein
LRASSARARDLFIDFSNGYRNPVYVVYCQGYTLVDFSTRFVEALVDRVKSLREPIGIGQQRLPGRCRRWIVRNVL